MAGVAERVFPTVLEPLRSRGRRARPLGDDDALRRTDDPAARRAHRVGHDDDTLRGIIATDALIGTFASLGETDLRQNVCFLYHLIGGGTGDWDVPVGGMGALTDSLAAAAVSAGATIVTGAEVASVDPSTGEVAWSGGSAGSGSAVGRTLVAGCAPPCSTACSPPPVPSRSTPSPTSRAPSSRSTCC